MKKKIKLMSLLMVFILSFSMLGACSSTTNGNTNNKSGSNQQMELRLLDYYGDQGARPDELNKVIAEFEKAHPNVKIKRETVPFGEMDRRVLQAATSHNVPDIMVPNLISMNTLHSAFVPLADYLPKSFLNQFYDGNVKAGTVNGKAYGIQVMGANNVALNYNKKLLQEAGIQPPKTWDELKSAAKALTKPGRYGLAVSAINTTEALWQFLPFFWTNGASLEKVNSPQGIKALEFLTSFIKDGSMSKEVVNWNQGAVLDQFVAGNAAMMINGPWNKSALDKSGIDYGVVEIPVPKEGMKPVVAIGGEVWGLGKTGNTEKTKMAAEFIKFLTSDQQRAMELSNAWGFLPSLKSLTEKFNASNPDLKPYADQMVSAKPMYSPKGYTKVDAIMQVAIQSALTGKATPEDALNQAAKDIEALN